MDGLTLKREVQLLLDEITGGSFLDDYTLFNFANEAALIINRITNSITNTQTITTVADQTDYTLNADFMKLYLEDRNGNLFVNYSDGSTTSPIKISTYQKFRYDNNTTSVDFPTAFCITDDRTLDTQVTGSITSTGTKSATSGESTLTDSAADFSDVSAGDRVHNTTSSSSMDTGVILEKTSSTVLVTAMFPGDPSGTSGDWDSSDTYVIQPRPRLKLVLDPPPSDSGDTITVEYVAKPEPVYANWRTFRFQEELNLAVVKYVAWLFKYKDREPNLGDKWYQWADREMRRAKSQYDSAFNRTGVPVRMKAR